VLKDERALVEAARQDAEAFIELYHAYMPRICRYLSFRLQDRQQAEDLTAAVFERALKGLHTFRPEKGSFAAWLFGIARNALSDAYRRRERRDETVSLEEAAPLAAREKTAEERLLRRERMARLESCLAALPAQEQQIIALKFGAGLTNRRIAEVMGLSETNVGTILYRTVRKLRDQLLDMMEEL
jgi:RNA polymerase sigma-70 factor (ECF subfamily)